ncbi:hypothetical protein PVOR_25508 [Paenibacillus vortex V453]|uniref:Uncharacterized protein n=1 Tax=Paenibacillus vortex V453 TaxID=715225 RepID=A0A2R9SPJ1_9BACL|nr:hypothetical protein [Paenibacillus vortex]EFU39310.1 hypothetical protein PVOR_25153 [Paenibacillus vortex V453]EFU39373.1 hypothetical protein PVOR_25508 [Paenibacillus vortex V453]
MNDKNRRELVSWRIGKLPDTEQLNSWVNAQSNVQNSITSLVRHMIEQFGYRDVTAHDIQKALFQKPIADELRSILSGLKDVPPISIPTSEAPSAKNEPEEVAENPTKNEINKPEAHKNSNDDIYGMIDKTNL